MRPSVNRVRERLGHLRRALISPSPQEWEAALPELARAIASMEASTQECKERLALGEAPEAGLRVDLRELRQEIGIAQKLLDRGRELCSARAILVATAAGGYSKSGEPAALRPGVTIRVEG